jgi:hypothetical protein
VCRLSFFTIFLRIVEAVKVKHRLPKISMEIGMCYIKKSFSPLGDTWVYGVPSDPIKVSQYREIGVLHVSILFNLY